MGIQQSHVSPTPLIKITNSIDKVFSVPASYPDSSKDRVWFWTRDGELHIDGGGVDVKVVEANIGATNGVIHSINKVGINGIF